MRFRFRYSLKAFFICWILIGLGLGWFGIHWERARRQAAAVRAIGPGVVVHDYVWEDFEEDSQTYWRIPGDPDGGEYDPDDWEYAGWNRQVIKNFPTSIVRGGAYPLEPEWLIRSLGEDFFHPITHYNYWSRHCDVRWVKPTLTVGFDKQMDHLAALPHLRHFTLWPNEIDVPQLMESILFINLGNLSELEELSLRGLPLSAEHLAPLRDHHKLRKLKLDDDKITDAALAALGTLPKLEELDLNGCSAVGKSGLSFLRTWKKLRQLELPAIDCDDRVLANLAELAELEALDLSYSSMSVETLQRLRKLPRLKRLNLAGVQLTDAELAEGLQDWSNLETLDLSYTNASELFAAVCPSFTGLEYLNLKGTPLSEEDSLSEKLTQQLEDCQMEFGSSGLSYVDPFGTTDPFSKDESDGSADPFE